MKKGIFHLCLVILLNGFCCGAANANSGQGQGTTPVLFDANADWYLEAAAGWQYPNFKSNTSIDNGSSFSPPFNQDRYTTRNDTKGIVAVSAGRRFLRCSEWFNEYSLGLTYQYAAAKNVGGKIVQYSNPLFTNYHYHLDLLHHVFLANLKLNIITYQNISPYLIAGLGFADTRLSNYNESPLPGLTAERISAGFKSNSNTHLAYALGAGISYQVAKQFIVAAEYQYTYLGNISTDKGGATWGNAYLNLGRYYTNSVLFNVIYLIQGLR